LLLVEPEDTMHHTTATALVITALTVLIIVSCFVLCFILRKYCRCAYDLRYSLNYGKANKGAVLLPTEDHMEAGDVSKGDSGMNSRYPSLPRQPQSRPPTPSQQRPPRPPAMAGRSAGQSAAAEQRPLLEKDGVGAGGEPKSLSVQSSGLYPAATETSHE